MADLYPYPVFFECRDLLEEHMKVIEKYFRVRRRSGGGDCGPLSRLGDDVYGIAFKNRKDQQAVLQRSEHVLELEDARLVFTVRDSLESCASSHIATPTAPAQTPEHIPAPSPLPSSEEYERHLDFYLLRYLTECPNAQHELERFLSSLGCSAELFPGEERVLVRRLAQLGAADEGSNWKAEVDALFDGYLCHYEVNREKIEVLIQSSSSRQPTDEVKVYTDHPEMAVVVGELSQVNARLLDIEQLSYFSDNMESLNLSEEGTIIASYSLYPGLQVLVCRGDITKQRADALVNAANQDLDHSGGVAAALSQAGGPDVQRESDELVKHMGKIPIGEVLVTTGGNLRCKKLMHAVGPVGGTAGVKERILLEKTVRSILSLSEILAFQSVAIPCISSGVFGVPLTVCCEAIVAAVKDFGSLGGRSLSKIILIDDRDEVVKAMQEACDRLIQGMGTGSSTLSDVSLQPSAPEEDSPGGATAAAPAGGVHVEIIQGSVETQQVDALVCPMVKHDPLSTRVGNTLFETAGPQLITSFRKNAEHETMPGDSVLVEGLPGLQSDAVFFLSLVPFDGDPDGVAVQVLRLGVNQILSSCEEKGFGSVALPVLGAGIALQFPPSVVEKVLMEAFHDFEQARADITPFLIRIVIHPSDEESSEVFESVQNDKFTEDDHQKDQNQEPTALRVVLLGKTGSGKSHLANTIFGEQLFATDHSPNSGTNKCEAKTRTVNGRSVTLIDTPGFFDTGRCEEDVKSEIMNCITECAPGPHAFLIVLPVGKFTEQEQAVVTKICQSFTDDALKHAVVVFTHGEQLPEREQIEDFVRQNENLSALVATCGGRCHVFDNKHWNNKQPNNYRSNQFQVEELLKTIETMVAEKNGGYYTNKMLQLVEEKIQEQAEHIRLLSPDKTPEEIRNQAKSDVCNRFLTRLTGIATGALLGGFLGVAGLVGLAITAMNNVQFMNIVRKAPAVAGVSAAAAGETALVAAGAVSLAVITTGVAVGGFIGNEAAKDAKSPSEAAQRTCEAVVEKGRSLLGFKKGF